MAAKVADLSPADLEERRRYGREYARNYRKLKNPELKYRYGLTLEGRDALLATQGGVCAICAGEATDVDHNHTTGAAAASA